MRLYPPGTALSPSGRVVMASCGRRPEICARVRGRCNWCDAEVPRGRHYWCSDACVEQFMRRTPERLRRVALDRARHVPRGRAVCALCTGVASEVDHTIPIIEGGEPFELDNLRALCTECHARETARLAGRRASSRLVIIMIARMLRPAAADRQVRMFEGIEGW